MVTSTSSNVGSQSTVQTIRDQDASISSSSNDWMASWKGVLVPLSGQSGNTTTPESASTSNTASPSDGLSAVVKGGIGVGTAVVALSIMCLCAFLYRRGYHRQNEEHLNGTSTSRASAPNMESVGSPANSYPFGGYGPGELSGNGIYRKFQYVKSGQNVPENNKVRPLYELDRSIRN